MKYILILLTVLCCDILFAQNIEKIKLKGEKDFGKREVLIYTPVNILINLEALKLFMFLMHKVESFLMRFIRL